MKFSILLLLGLSLSCGRYEVLNGPNATVGETKALTIDSLSTDDINSLSQICTALTNKMTTLSGAVGSTFTFSTSQTDCDGQPISSGDVQTYIQNSGSNYTFKRKSDSSDFFFADVESASSGTMGIVCGALGNQKNTIISGQEATTFRASNVLSTDCPPAFGEICVYVEKAAVQTDSNNKSTLTVHTKEWIRFRTNSTQGKIGFFTFRKKVSQSYCAQNKSQILSATLK